jgi:pimeloyl-ACP methyl ester carboxylesterase
MSPLHARWSWHRPTPVPACSSFIRPASARWPAQPLRTSAPFCLGSGFRRLLVYGEHDIRAPLPVAWDLEAAITGARLVVLPGVGHLCNLEAPDEFNGAVRTFLHDTIT